jgi:hypothetical protein
VPAWTVDDPAKPGLLKAVLLKVGQAANDRAIPRIDSSDQKKIKHCFFGAYQGKIANCVSASTAAQHIEASIKRNQYPT